MSKHLQRDLERLNERILTLGAKVEEAANKAITALLARRRDLADEVCAGDEAIDEGEVEIELECLKILALHQPVAQDLRYIVSVLKVNNDLERIGDLAVNLAERALLLLEYEPIRVPVDLPRMADDVRTMIHTALESLVQRDARQAREVLAMDDRVDETHTHMFEAVEQLIREDVDRIRPAIATLSASRYLERMADLATNVAEDVVFLVEGEVIRHATVPVDEDAATAEDATA
ncbi:MAG: phosphate transport system regulatory protein PhoU [Planctomycetota bacterium]|nr:MAG: phosphate transport system regulatory protein PhoU [Planctomycetota bacterium]